MKNRDFSFDAAFPYPKLIQAINFFFPKKEGEPEVFTRENLAKLARFAPYLGFIILLVILISLFRAVHMVETQEEAIGRRFFFYMVFDFFIAIGSIVEYFRWLFYAFLAKMAKRSADVPLIISFLAPLKFLGILGLLHFIIYATVFLYNLSEQVPK